MILESILFGVNFRHFRLRERQHSRQILVQSRVFAGTQQQQVLIQHVSLCIAKDSRTRHSDQNMKK
jgi:hypothetical protein